jgi:hypothetical protein
MVFNATFNNLSVISWRSVLLVEETGVPRKITDLSQVIGKLYHINSSRGIFTNASIAYLISYHGFMVTMSCIRVSLA